MPWPLATRAEQLGEQLESPHADRAKILRTYRQFAIINGLLSRWRWIYCRHIRPVLREQGRCRILDIGFGGGDIPLRVLDWARADGADIEILAIDRSEFAMEFVAARRWPAGLAFRRASTTDLCREGLRFDVVLSNHVIHELSAAELTGFLDSVRVLASRRVIFNDIRRSALGYALFALSMTPLLHRSYAVRDGLTSIRRSYTVQELRAIVPAGWTARSLFPFRLLLMFGGDA